MKHVCKQQAGPEIPREVVVDTLQFDDPFTDLGSTSIAQPESQEKEFEFQGQRYRAYFTATSSANTPSGRFTILAGAESCELHLDSQGCVEQIRWGWRQLSPEAYPFFIADKGDLLRATAQAFSGAPAEHLLRFIEEQKIELPTQSGLNAAGFTYRGSCERHLCDPARDTRVQVDCPDRCSINLYPVRGTLECAEYRSGNGDKAEALIALGGSQLDVRMQHSAPEMFTGHPKVSNISINLLDRPTKHHMLDSAASRKLSDMPIRFRIGRQEYDPLADELQGRMPSVDWLRALKDLMKQAPITVYYEGEAEDPPVLLLDFQPPQQVGWNTLVNNHLKIRPFDGTDNRLIAVAIQTHGALGEEIQAGITANGTVSLQQNLDWRGRKTKMSFDFECDISERGELDVLLPSGDTMTALYQIAKSSREISLDLTLKGDDRLRIELSGQPVEQISLWEFSADGTYLQLEVQQLREKYRSEMAALLQELQGSRLLSLIAPLFHGLPPSRPSSKADPTGLPLAEGRWERLFGPLPEHYPTEHYPTHLRKDYDSDVGERVQHGVRWSTSAREELSPFNTAPCAEGFEVMERSAMRVAELLYARAVLRGQMDGFLTTEPSTNFANDPLGINVTVSSDKLYLNSLTSHRRGERYRVIFNCSEWELRGFLSKAGRVSDFSAFVLDRSLEEIKAVEFQQITADGERKSVDTIPGITEEVLSQQLREMLTRLYTRAGDALVRPSALQFHGSPGGQERMSRFLERARCKALFQASPDLLQALC